MLVSVASLVPIWMLLCVNHCLRMNYLLRYKSTVKRHLTHSVEVRLWVLLIQLLATCLVLLNWFGREATQGWTIVFANRAWWEIRQHLLHLGSLTTIVIWNEVCWKLRRAIYLKTALRTHRVSLNLLVNFLCLWRRLLIIFKL